MQYFFFRVDVDKWLRSIV